MENEYSHLELMQLAINEQQRCTTFPKVGAIVVKDGRVLATGFRGEVEGKHAERIALMKAAKQDLIGATLVTTLEPCVEIREGQPERSCTDLIVSSKIGKVIIGVLDPNGQIYCEGYEKLLAAKISVEFFPQNLRDLIENDTFKYGDCNRGFGPTGKRRTAVIGSGKAFELQFSRSDTRSVKFRWNTLQFRHGIVDLVGPNDSIREAKGASKFEDISDPLVFRDPSHYARMRVDDIAVLYASNAPFIVLIRLLQMSETDIMFQWQVREIDKANQRNV